MSKPYNFLVLVLAITFLVLLPTLRNDWTNLDDPAYILDNPIIQDLSWNGIQKMFTTLQVNGSYNPIVLISWAIDYSFVGLAPSLYHTTNLLLHLIVVALVFFLALRLSKNNWVAFGTALLFGIHPMHVESVAWVTSRKELLYTLFYIGGLIAYHFYLEKNTRYSKLYYLVLSFILFLLSLFSKGSAITFPLILWAFDYLSKRKDITRLLIEKIPFILLSVVFTYLSIKAQDEGNALLYREFYSVFDSLSVGFFGYLTYLIKVLIPYNLSGLHPYPTPSGTPVPWYFSVAAIPVLAIAIYCFYKIKTTRNLVFGFGFFFITLIPVIQVLSFAVSVTADRFTYLPYFGLFYLLSLGVFGLINHKPKLKTTVKIVSFVFIITFGVTTFSYAQTWKNSETVWSRVIKYYPEYFISYINRSEYRINNGQLDKALQDCNKAIRLKKDYFLAYYNRGYIYQKKGDITKAIQDYTLSIAYNDQSFQAYQNRGILYAQLNQLDKALNDFDVSIAIKPKDPYAYLNRAFLFEKKGKYTEAISDATQVISINNKINRAYLLRGSSYQVLGQTNNALQDYTSAIKLNPKMVKAYTQRGSIYFNQKKIPEATDDFQKAIQVDRHNVDGHINLGVILMNQSLYDKALFHFNQAHRYDSTNYLVYFNRGIVYKLMENYTDALKDIDKCLELQPGNKIANDQRVQILKLIQALETNN
ncbi:tetratricopeptide repeat protein [Aquimarina sp. 2201CG5-10]|uniref:tetratricopeptide repeat protein n=1 Tax=Aquimarina callyspongiae TaxID=3098150 RepID=UPI002AB58CE1|nr:tetratricopeptide repeat protein [Aquimarina sp. 2201CG5-10]MDY8135849.1 tetratricopeptide repeat protein [Aquimarina sp. 2201CG5-10]